MPNGSKLLFFTVLGDSGDAPVQCFFDFFMTAPSITPTLESISEGLPSRNALKSRGFRWSCPTKVEKTSCDSSMALGSSGPAVGGSGPEMLSKVEVVH